MTALTTMLELQSRVTVPREPLTLDLLTLLWNIRDEASPGSHKLACTQLAKSIINYRRITPPTHYSPYRVLKDFNENRKTTHKDLQLVVQMAVENLQGIYSNEG